MTTIQQLYHVFPCFTNVIILELFLSGHMTYYKNGCFTVHPVLKRDKDELRKAKHFGMIAGGTGITPMLQIIHAALRDEPNSNVTCSLIYANQTEDDILVREELEAAVEKFGGRFKLHYTLDRPPQGDRRFRQ